MALSGRSHTFTHSAKSLRLVWHFQGDHTCSHTVPRHQDLCGTFRKITHVHTQCQAIKTCGTFRKITHVHTQCQDIKTVVWHFKGDHTHSNTVPRHQDLCGTFRKITQVHTQCQDIKTCVALSERSHTFTHSAKSLRLVWHFQGDHTCSHTVPRHQDLCGTFRKITHVHTQCQDIKTCVALSGRSHTFTHRAKTSRLGWHFQEDHTSSHTVPRHQDLCGTFRKITHGTHSAKTSRLVWHFQEDHTCSHKVPSHQDLCGTFRKITHVHTKGQAIKTCVALSGRSHTFTHSAKTSRLVWHFQEDHTRSHSAKYKVVYCLSICINNYNVKLYLCTNKNQLIYIRDYFS